MCEPTKPSETSPLKRPRLEVLKVPVKEKCKEKLKGNESVNIREEKRINKGEILNFPLGTTPSIYFGMERKKINFF